MIIHSPLTVSTSKHKRFTLNLNNYRNTHFQILNASKRNYKMVMADQISLLPVLDRIVLVYTLFPKTRRLTDLDNVLSIHSKFFQDALVECGKLPEDNYKYVQAVHFHFGSVCKELPRVNIEIVSI